MTVQVQAKFRCLSVSQSPTAVPGTTYVQVNMHPVWEQEGVNKKWSQATPSGQLSLNITNPDAINWFEQGKEYMLTITPAS